MPKGRKGNDYLSGINLSSIHWNEKKAVNDPVVNGCLFLVLIYAV